MRLRRYTPATMTIEQWSFHPKRSRLRTLLDAVEACPHCRHRKFRHRSMAFHAEDGDPNEWMCGVKTCVCINVGDD